jgi:cellulose synthase/poly-beta-1,6-N-acetylglucosamine synthase-like glycosyltransferase
MQDPSWVVILVWGTWLLLTILIDGVPIPFKLYFSKKTRRKVDTRVKDDELPEVSIVVPAHNEEATIGVCLESLVEAHYPHGKMEIILVDDGSTDNTIPKAELFESRAVECGKKLRIIKRPHTGKVQALNTGLKMTRGGIIVTIDADARMAPDAIHNIVVPFVREEEVGAATGYIEIMVPESGIRLDKTTRLTPSTIGNILHVDGARDIEVITHLDEYPLRDAPTKGALTLTPVGFGVVASSIHADNPHSHIQTENINPHIHTINSNPHISVKNTNPHTLVVNPDIQVDNANPDIQDDNVNHNIPADNPLIQVREYKGDKDGILETFFARCEFLEYITAFNFERSYQSYVQSIYSMSGAFSAFRREVIGKVGGYWPLTVAEDMHMTMMLHNRKVSIIHVPEAVAYVEAITDYDTLYSQRVRWARGQIEVASMQEKQCPITKDDVSLRDMLSIAWEQRSPGMIWSYITNRISIKIQRLRQCTYSSFNFMGLQRILLVDHTIAFPRLLWVFVLALFPILGLYLYIIPIVTLLLYAFYVTIDLVVIIFVYQNSPKNTKHNIERYFPFILLLPIYRLMTFFFRLSAFLQVLKEPSDWTVDGPVNGFKEGVKDAKDDASAAKEIIVTMIFKLADSVNVNLENMFNQGRKGK